MIQDTYRLNAQKIVSETVDGETIVINLEAGNYYSLNQSASVIWNLAILKHRKDDISSYLMARYHIDKEASDKYLDTFLGLLLKDGLLIESDDSAMEPIPAWTSAPETFEPPSCERYEDMQEMLLADPIHDVNESGWPILKKDAA